MPAVRLIASKYYTLFTSSIVFDGEIMSPCFYYNSKCKVYKDAKYGTG